MICKEKFNVESQLFIGLFDAMPFNVYVADIANHNLIFMNKNLRESFGEIAKRKCYEVIYDQDRPCLHCPINQLINAKGLPTGETLVSELFNDVDDNWYQLQDRCITWPDGSIAKYSIGVNITLLKQTQNHLAEAHAELALKAKVLEALSVTDPLTQLLNRLKIDQILTEAFKHCQRYSTPLSVIMMDLDKFKSVNDLYGHLVGDRVLCQTAKILQGELRQQDHLARWGGEEFVIVCPETNLEEALQVAEKLRLALAQFVFPEINKMTGSFGVSCYEQHESIDNMLAKADKGLYFAKNHGRNQVCAIKN